jgi:hypothetical protein
VTPIAAILINIQLQLPNPNYCEEGATLALTLLPFLNKVDDYSFLDKEASFIASRFLASLVRHITDTHADVEVGFMTFGLKYDPAKLRQLVNIN